MLPGGKVIVEDAKALPVLEGPKLYKRNGWYYIFAPIGGVETGPQAVLRSRDIWGPYEHRDGAGARQDRLEGPAPGRLGRDPVRPGLVRPLQQRRRLWPHRPPAAGVLEGRLAGDGRADPRRGTRRDRRPACGPARHAGCRRALPAGPAPDLGLLVAGAQPRAAMGVEPQSRRPPLEPDPAAGLPAPDLGARAEPGLGPQHPDPGAAERALDHHHAPGRRRPGRRPARGSGDVRPGDQLDRRGAARRRLARDLLVGRRGDLGPPLPAKALDLRVEVADQTARYSYSLDGGKTFCRL